MLGAFLSGAGPSVALLARVDATQVATRLSSMYERAGVEATVRTLVDDQARGPRVGSSEENGMKFVAGLTCHLCGATYRRRPVGCAAIASVR